MSKVTDAQGVIIIVVMTLAVIVIGYRAYAYAARSYPDPEIHIIAEGLVGPLGMAYLPDGSLLVAEAGTGEDDQSAGVRLIRPSGEVRRLISGLSSQRDSGDLAGVNFVSLAPSQDQLYIGHFNDQRLWTLPLTSSWPAASWPQQPFTIAQLIPTMTPLHNVYLTNPFDLAFDAQSIPVVTDASANGVAKANPDGTTRFIHRFEPLPNLSTKTAHDVIDPVPTGMIRLDNEYYITLTGGCPYPEGSGQLVAIDEQRNQRTILTDLNMPIDVAQGPDGTIWLLEFARFTAGDSCFDGQGYQAHTGRLSYLSAEDTLVPVLSDLNFPAAILPHPDGSLYISLVFSGEILHLTF